MKDEKTEYVTDDVDVVAEEAKSVSSDDALLISMGKKPELKRVYNFWTRRCFLQRTSASSALLMAT